jgi:hypothetical protein
MRLTELPEDVLLHILNSLCVHELANTAMINKEICGVINKPKNDRALWKKFVKQGEQDETIKTFRELVIIETIQGKNLHSLCPSRKKISFFERHKASIHPLLFYLSLIMFAWMSFIQWRTAAFLTIVCFVVFVSKGTPFRNFRRKLKKLNIPLEEILVTLSGLAFLLLYYNLCLIRLGDAWALILSTIVLIDIQLHW